MLDAIIEEDEANSSARKRKIAIFKAQGDRSRTVAELNKYLKIFMSDQVSSYAKGGLRIKIRLHVGSLDGAVRFIYLGPGLCQGCVLL